MDPAPTFPATSGLSLEEFKRTIDKQLSGDDDVLLLDLESAFEQAQAPAPYGCGRLLVPNPPGDGDDPVEERLTTYNRHVLIPDAREITQVLVDDVAETAYTTLSKNGHIVQLTLPRRRSWRDSYDIDCDIPRVVKVTGRFGFAAIPASLRNAIYLLAGRYNAERDAMFSDHVQVAEGAPAQTYYRQLPSATRLTFSSFWLPTGLGGVT